jgi:hypothetical protein
MALIQYFLAGSLDGFIPQEDDGLQWRFDAADDPTIYSLNVPSR